MKFVSHYDEIELVANKSILIFGNNLSLNSELTFKETCKLDVWRLGLLLVKRVLENFDISKIYLMKEEMKV